MQSKTFFLCLLLVVIGTISTVQGWGNDGHQIVGQIAQEYLTSATQQQVNKILGSYSLANVSTWPDNYDHTSEGAWSERLHYVNEPQTALSFNYSVCFPANEPPGCVIAAIQNMTYILKHDFQNDYYQYCDDPNAEPCPLSFLTHFLGDSHQPLHVAYAVDIGGNDFYVEYDNECTNLHSVWDSRLIYTYEDDNDIEWYAMSQQILTWLNKDQEAIRIFTNTTNPEAWGSETFAIARFAPYNLAPGTVPAASNWVHGVFNYSNNKNHFIKTANSESCGSDPVLTYQYYQKTMPVVMDQLAKAGTRLAYLLNTIFDPSFHGF